MTSLRRDSTRVQNGWTDGSRPTAPLPAPPFLIYARRYLCQRIYILIFIIRNIIARAFIALVEKPRTASLRSGSLARSFSPPFPLPPSPPPFAVPCRQPPRPPPLPYLLSPPESVPNFVKNPPFPSRRHHDSLFLRGLAFQLAPLLVRVDVHENSPEKKRKKKKRRCFVRGKRIPRVSWPDPVRNNRFVEARRVSLN